MLPVLALVLLFGLSAEMQADQLSFQQGVNGYTGTHDTELSQANPNANNGALTGVSVDLQDPNPNWAQGMIKFADIFGTGPNQLRLGTNILVARLRMYTFDPGSDGPHIHRMLFDWSQATATWNSMACCGNMTPGAQPDDVDATTTDHDGDGVPGIRVANAGVDETFTEIDITADVQAWSDGAGNFGWAFVANGGNGWDWTTSEGTIVDRRPRLFVEFGTREPPVFTLQPTNQTVEQARTASFTVAVTGSQPIALQWHKDGFAIDPLVNPSATTTTLTLVNVQEADEGTYHCHASNSAVPGDADSNPATLTVDPDIQAPLMLSVIGSSKFDSVIVQFNEAMNLGTIQDNFNWAITDPDNNAIAILDPVAATLSADGTVATVAFAAGVFLAENTVYKVSVSGLADYTGNFMTDTNLSFTSYVSGCNTFLFEAFDTASTPGNAITLLTSHPNYPNNPRDVAAMAGLDSRYGYPDNSHEQFGARIRGLFVPDLSGPWVFYLASDDAGQLFVNPTGPDAAGKQLVAQETGCCGNFQAPGDPRTSVPINLTAGQAYYMEALFKEGTGGDWLKVAARRAGEPTPVGGNSDNAGLSPNALQGSAGPAGILSFVTIGTQPQSQSKIAGQVAAFSVGLSPDVPGCFQWRRDDGTGAVDIPGAVGPNYRLTTSLADNGAKFRCAISLMGGTTLLSDEATLTVENDVTAPFVVSVTRNLADVFTVTFSEPIEMTGLTNPANYAIDGANPASATASGSSAVVLVPSTAVAPCPASHSIQVGNVQDMFGNTITPNPTFVGLTLNDLLVLPVNANVSWRFEESGNELGDAWYATAFDDSVAGWSNGPPALGVESAAALPPGFPIRTTHNWSPVKPTVYYRAHFNLPSDPSSVTNLQLHHYIDDGAVFYLNGQELTRVRMPGGTVDTNVLAANATENATITITDVPAGALAFGDNVLAARVHQSSTTSSDIVFLAGVVAQTTGCAAQRPRLAIAINGNQVTISVASGPNGTIYRSSSLDGPWVSVGAAPQTVTVGPAQEFFEIRP